MNLLALDTATEICGVALVLDGRLAARLSLALGNTHARELMPAVDWILQRVGLASDQVDVFAVNQGPGSFTGLRIGISTANGLASATGKPLIGITTLEALAHQAPTDEGLVCPMIDARRSEVYWSLYQHRDGQLILLGPPRVDTPETVAALIPAECTAIGNGVRVYEEVLRRHCSVVLHWVPDHLNDLCPGTLARLAYDQWLSGYHDSGRVVEPVYVRESDARLPSA